MKHPRLTLLVALSVATFAGSALTAFGDPQPAVKRSPADADNKTPADADKWMRLKLHSSQEIFTALMHGDSKAIETNARRMLVLNLLEQWIADRPLMNQAGYQAQLNAFEFATKELVRTGNSKDIDGALEAYGRLANSCVKCHQLIRDVPARK